MKHNEKESRLKQLLTKKNIAILSTAITVCIAVAIAIPLCVLSEQTPPVSNEMPETSSYVITETLSEESNPLQTVPLKKKTQNIPSPFKNSRYKIL